MSYSPYQSRPVEKLEEELAIHIRKALSTEESAPKQKHVRACILYTWELKGCGSFWRAMKTYPALGDEIVIFKMLITLHKVMRQGHPDVRALFFNTQVLREGIRERNFINSLARNVSHYGGMSSCLTRRLRGFDKGLCQILGYKTRVSRFSSGIQWKL